MQYLLFFGDKPVYLCDETNEEMQELMHHPDTVFIDEGTPHAINSLLHEIKKPGFHAGIMCVPNLEQVRKSFWKHFKVIQAAGGLVTNGHGEVLLIFRKGRWDLPKGKLDAGETLEACALREVEEETGLQGLVPGKPLITTYHTYDEFGKHILKESYWFAMQVKGRQQPVPQTEEDITDIEWVSVTQLASKTNNMYPSIRLLLETSGFIPKSKAGPAAS